MTRRSQLVGCLGLALAMAHAVCGHADEPEPSRRAARPKWTADVAEVFFADARAQLVGERPQSEGRSAIESLRGAAGSTAESADSYRWSSLLDGETLADEVKRIGNSLRAPLASPGKFKAGGNQLAADDFALLAVLFRVVAEFDGEVRWKPTAPAAVQAFTAAAEACSDATDDAYAAAQLGTSQLEDLLRGETLTEEEPPGRGVAWSELLGLPAAMRRMEAAWKDRISPALADARSLSRQSNEVAEEAELLALLAEVVTRDDFEFRDDPEYLRPAAELREAAGDLSRAAAKKDYEAARRAGARAERACAACHEQFRG